MVLVVVVLVVVVVVVLLATRLLSSVVVSPFGLWRASKAIRSVRNDVSLIDDRRRDRSSSAASS